MPLNELKASLQVLCEVQLNFEEHSLSDQLREYFLVSLLLSLVLQEEPHSSLPLVN